MGVYSDGKGGMVFGEPEDKGKRLVCAKCGNPICIGQQVSYEPAKNTITHVVPKCEDIK